MQPFWEHYEKKFWGEADWETWAKAGRPKVPSHLDLQPPPEPEMGKTFAVTPPTGPQSAVTTLFPKAPARASASARSKAVDRLIEENLGR